MNAGTQRWCAWAAVPMVGLLFAGLIISGFLPPVAPGQPAEALRTLFVEHRVRIRVGMLTGLLGTGFAGPFVAAISTRLRRAEGRVAPLASAQLMLGVMLPVGLILPLSWLLAAAYRPDRDAQSIQLLSDQAWFLLVGAFYAFVVQLGCIAVAVLRDPAEHPAFPRWVGYLNLWCAIGSLPAAGVYFVHDGPLAWNGLLSFWLPAACFGLWALTMMTTMLRATPPDGPGTEADAVRGAPADAAAPAGLSDADLDRLAHRVAELLHAPDPTPPASP